MKIEAYRCLTDDCQREGFHRNVLYSGQKEPKCPNCGHKENMHKLETVHLLCETDSDTPLIRGGVHTGQGHRKWDIACGAKRQPGRRTGPQMTDQVVACTCFACLSKIGAMPQTMADKNTPMMIQPKQFVEQLIKDTEDEEGNAAIDYRGRSTYRLKKPRGLKK